MAYPSFPPKDHSLKRTGSLKAGGFKSPLPSIEESTREVILNDQRTNIKPPSPPPSTTSSNSTRTRKISLFPDPSRLNPKEKTPQLRIVIPSPELNTEVISDLSDKGSKTGASTPADDRRKGLARARERAQARKRANTSPLFNDLKTKQQELNGTSSPGRGIKKFIADFRGLKSSSESIDNSSASSIPTISPGELRRKLSSPQLGSHRRTLSENDPMDLFGHSIVLSPSKSMQSIRPVNDVHSAPTDIQSPSRSTDTPPPSTTKSSRRLQQVLDMKISHPTHVRQSSSLSSFGSRPQSPVHGASSSISPAPGTSSDDNSETSRKNHSRKNSSSSRLPKGMPPQVAVQSLPPSVKQALGSHAQSESMGYLVLLPHEVVQLNEEHLTLEKQIETIKKELNSVRYQSAQLHEKMLDELRACAATPITDSSIIDKLLSLQIDVATVEVRLDHTSRRLSKAQHRRADVRERLLMHLAGTHAMLGYERHLMEKGSTPPDSPVIPQSLML